MALKKPGKKLTAKKLRARKRDIIVASMASSYAAGEKTWYHWTFGPCLGTISKGDYGFIYRVTRKVDGKDYIGMKSYHTNPEKYFTSGKYIKADIDKLGIDAFDFEILFSCRNKTILRSAEITLQIEEDVLNNPNNYNRHIGALLWFNDKCSAETRAKLSKASKGHKRLVGHKQSDETKAKRSKSNSGKVRTAEHKENYSESKKGDKNPMSGPKWKLKCEHCGVEASKNNYTRWHGDNCKHKQTPYP